MNLDLLAMAFISITAVLVVATIANLLGATGQGKIRIGAVLGVWFGSVLAIGATRVLFGGSPVRAAGLGMLVVLPVILLCLATLLSKTWRARAPQADLRWLVSVQSLRLLGVMFVLLYAAHRLPAPFAPVAGWGDMLVGLLAIPVSWALVDRKSRRWPLVLWTVMGMADLITAVMLGALSAPGPFQVLGSGAGSAIMTTLPWILIPGFLVPCFFFLHIVVLAKMRSGEPFATRPSATLQAKVI